MGIFCNQRISGRDHQSRQDAEGLLFAVVAVQWGSSSSCCSSSSCGCDPPSSGDFQCPRSIQQHSRRGKAGQEDQIWTTERSGQNLPHLVWATCLEVEGGAEPWRLVQNQRDP